MLWMKSRYFDAIVRASKVILEKWYFFNDIWTFVGYFNTKTILVKEQLWYYLVNNLQDKGFLLFSGVFVRKWMQQRDWGSNSLTIRLQHSPLSIISLELPRKVKWDSRVTQSVFSLFVFMKYHPQV